MKFKNKNTSNTNSREYPLFEDITLNEPRDDDPAFEADDVCDDDVWDETALEQVLAVPEGVKPPPLSSAAKTDKNVLSDYPAQIWRWFKYLAYALAGCWLIGWPVGDLLSYKARYGSTSGWQFLASYDLAALIYAIITPILVLLIGYVLAVGLRMTRAAERVSRTAEAMLLYDEKGLPDMMHPAATPPHITEFKSFIDEALTRLCATENVILEQISTIETATRYIERGSAGLDGDIANERKALISLTEQMNSEADLFAQAIARKAQLATSATTELNAQLDKEENELDRRLLRIEAVSNRALTHLENLKTALSENDTLIAMPERIIEPSENTARHLKENTAAILEARQSLEEESARLESLIGEQRDRADRLADILMDQSNFIVRTGIKHIDSALPLCSKDSNNTADEEISPEYREAVNFQLSASTQFAPLKIHLSNKGTPVDKYESTPISEAHNTSLPQENSAHINSLQERFHKNSQTTKMNHADKAPLALPTAQKTTTHSTQTQDLVSLLSENTHLTSPKEIEVNPHEKARADSTRYEIVQQLHDASLILYVQLFGVPQSALLQRYENGERNIFVNTILRENEREMKETLLETAVTDNEVAEALRKFLVKFDSLLETAQDIDIVEKDLDDLIATPLGRLYVLIGTCGFTF